MQRLRVKYRDENGKEQIKEVRVLRSWQDASGRQIYLHHDGVYGYKDGAPVKEIRDFDIIGNERQRQAALYWWRAKGEGVAGEYYAAVAARESALAGDFQPVDDIFNSDLDHAMYQKRSVAAGKESEWSAPFAWMDQFEARPEWWGQADMIVFKNVEYRRVVEGQIDAHSPPPSLPCQGGGEKPGDVVDGKKKVRASEI